MQPAQHRPRTPPQASSALLARYRFDARRFAAFQDAVASGRLFPGSTEHRGPLRPPRPGDILELPPAGAERAALSAEGLRALAAGEVAVVVLAGGMATRFSGAGEGVVKGAVDVTDGFSFLALKIAQVRALAREVRRDVPIALMASFATDEGLRRHLDEHALAGPDIEVFTQSIGLRLLPTGEVLGADAPGPLPMASYTAPGHGDFFAAIRASGTLARLRDCGVRTIWLCNVDNLGATLEPALVGLFARAHAERGTTMMAEVVARRPEDGAKVGVVVRTDEGGRDLLRIVEGFRIPEGVVQDALRDVSINTFMFAAAALADDVALDVHAVAKKVEGREVLQGESILCEATGALRPDGSLRFRFDAVRVPREGPPGRFFDGRFAPVKTPADLEALREPVRASLPGLLPARTRRRQRAVETVLRGFFDRGDRAEGGTFTIWSPGRINLIGEHTDYSEGFCLPAAIDHGLWAAVRARADRRVLVRSNIFPDVVELSLDGAGPDPAPHEPAWGRSLHALLPLLAHLASLRGAQIALETDLAPGAGMSSSASFHLAVAAALARAAGADVEPLALARIAQQTENALGLRVGILDPYAIVHARRGYALWLDCRALTHVDVPLDLGPYVLVVGDTGKPRGLVDSAYNERRAQCEEAAKWFAELTGRAVRTLRDVTRDDLAIHGAALPPVLAARATHVVEENARVEAAVHALRDGDTAGFGALLNASHRSLRDLFEVSVFELDALVDAARSLGPELVPGARMMGGGFGGSILALVRADVLDRFVAEVGARYREATGREAAFTPVAPEDGLGALRA